jgi:hypothetical protein
VPDKGQRRRKATPKTRPSIDNIRELPFETPPNYDESHPVFCLQHLHSDFNVKHTAMSKDARAAFAEQLESLASLTWAIIKRSGRHGLGFEKLPVTKLRMALPNDFEDETEVLVFRYHGNLPMAGVRRHATLHLFALEREYGDLYDHGD